MGTACRICRSGNLREFKVGQTLLLRCGDCGVVFNAAFPSDGAASSYYRQTFQPFHDERIAVERRRICCLPEQIRLIAQIAAVRPAPASILDIGCDRGFFLDEARRYGYAVQGVEPSDRAREYCAAIALPVAVSLAELPGPYDVATMWHSLEHLVDPLAFLGDLRAKLRKDGLVFIRVPDFGCSWRRILKRRWQWFQPQNHFFHYTRVSLRGTLERAGFAVLLLRSQRPNDAMTSRATRLARTIFHRHWNAQPTVRQRLADLREHLTCYELLAVGRKT